MKYVFIQSAKLVFARITERKEYPPTWALATRSSSPSVWRFIALFALLLMTLPSEALANFYAYTGQTGAAQDLGQGVKIVFPFRVNSAFIMSGGAFEISNGNSGGDVTLKLFSDSASGTQLRSVTVSEANAGGPGYVVTKFTFSSSISLEAGKLYYAEISSNTTSRSALHKIKNASNGATFVGLNADGTINTSDTVNTTASGGDWGISVTSLTANADIAYGSAVKVKINLTNNGAGTQTGATVKFGLPSGLTYSSVSNVSGETLGTWSCSASGQIVTCSTSGISIAPAGTTYVAVNTSPAINFGTSTTYGTVDPSGSTGAATPDGTCTATYCGSVAHSPTSRSISGTVKNSSGTGVSGVSLKLMQAGTNTALQTVTSGAGGSFSFSGILKGTYDLEFGGGGTKVKAKKSGSNGNYSSTRVDKLESVTTTSGDLAGIEGFVIDPAGTVYDSVSRDALSGATVTLQYSSTIGGAYSTVSNSWLDTTNGDSNPKTTDGTGGYSFLLTSAASTGYYKLLVSKTGYSYVSTVIPPTAAFYSPALGGGLEQIVGNSTPPTGATSTTYYTTFNYTITDTASTSSNGIVNNHLPLDPPVGFTLSKNSLTVSETGSTASFTVVLDTKPETDVVLSVTGSDSTEASLSPSSLTFTSSNWNTAQTITVTGVNDNDTDGTIASTITVSVVDASSNNPFDSLADKTVSVSTTDDDSASFAVSGGRSPLPRWVVLGHFR